MTQSERLEIANLFVDRGRRPVLRDVHLTLGPAEILSVLGANGAGKSTLVLAIGGLLPVRSGTMTLGAVSLVGAAPHEIRRSGIAIVHQGHPVLNGITVLDNLRAAGLFLGKGEADRQVEAALGVLPELKPKLGVDASALSGGQKQMLCIAQALIIQPRFLLIDELSFGLAPAVVSRLGDIIKNVAREGVGVLLIEQFTSLALSLADRAMLLERGKVVFEGTAQELRERPSILHGSYLAVAEA